jgi:hypothetical protein
VRLKKGLFLSASRLAGISLRGKGRKTEFFFNFVITISIVPLNVTRYLSRIVAIMGSEARPEP